MREIKFRAWDIKRKQWLQGFDFAISGDGDVYEYTRSLSEDGYIHEIQHPEIQQYTGLHDKNGKEIYEGDIMKAELPPQDIDSISGILNRKTIIGEVRIRSVGGVGMLIRKIIGDEDDSGIQKGSFLRIKQGNDTVIGNIFEHPELVAK